MTSPPLSTVHLALGSNLGDRAGQMDEAIRRLAPDVRVTRRSPIYETAPMYVTDQPAFLNMAMAGETTLDPHALLDLAKRIEADLGRARGGPRFGPRVVDIDILFHGSARLAEARLEIPHPRLAERAFVLRPLADIAPELVHPTLGLTVGELLARVAGADTVVRWSAPGGDQAPGA